MLEYSTADIFLYVLFCLVIIPLGLVIGRKLYIDKRNEEHKYCNQMANYEYTTTLAKSF